jgi:hypothetical protein|nr:MAG TPA: protein of unknown function (DUF4452) [Caudoviricetes sp.]
MKKEYRLLDVAIELEKDIKLAMALKCTDSYDTIHVYYSFNNSVFYVSELPLLANSVELLSCYYDELNERSLFYKLINNLKELNITFETDITPMVDFDLEDDLEYCY